MTLATQTWRASADYGFTIAGATPTCAETLAAINAMLVAENTADNNYWQVSHYSSTNGTLEIKRKGTPSGTLATYRGLFFGKAATTPNINAINQLPSPSQDALRIFACSSNTANTTGPSVSFSTNAPYTVTYSPAIAFLQLSSCAKTDSPTVCMVECDECCCIIVRTTTGRFMAMFGAVVAKHDDTALWGFVTQHYDGLPMVTGDMFKASEDYGNNAGRFPLGIGNNCSGSVVYYDTNPYYAGSIHTLFSSVTISCMASAADNIILFPIHLATRLCSSSGWSSATYIGTLRQIKMGPHDTLKRQIVHPVATVRAIFVSDKGASANIGTYFDNLP